MCNMASRANSSRCAGRNRSSILWAGYVDGYIAYENATDKSSHRSHLISRGIYNEYPSRWSHIKNRKSK